MPHRESRNLHCICTHIKLIHRTNPTNFSVVLTEIARIRASLFQINGDEKKPLVLPEPEGAVIMRTEKVYVPVEEHPEVSLFCATQLTISLTNLLVWP